MVFSPAIFGFQLIRGRPKVEIHNVSSRSAVSCLSFWPMGRPEGDIAMEAATQDVVAATCKIRVRIFSEKVTKLEDRETAHEANDFRLASSQD
jgi:hypothetical protein